VFGISLLAILVLAGCSKTPMQEQANAALPLSNSPPVDLTDALEQAKAQNKLVFLNFTGSDWCPSCIDLHPKIFSQPEFQSYAQSNLVFLTVDFPLKFRLPPETSATNNSLAQQFDVEGTPTLIALNGDGKQVWKHLGLIDGGPKELFEDLAAAKNR